jgi:hypothetical protein
MSEGDPSVAKWQVDYETSTVGLSDKAPDGFVAAGPWFPFAVVVATDREDGDYTCTHYRRPLKRAEEWVALRDLPPGFLFRTRDGGKFVRTIKQHAPDEWTCIDLGSGLPAYFNGDAQVCQLPKP